MAYPTEPSPTFIRHGKGTTATPANLVSEKGPDWQLLNAGAFLSRLLPMAVSFERGMLAGSVMRLEALLQAPEEIPALIQATDPMLIVDRLTRGRSAIRWN